MGCCRPSYALREGDLKRGLVAAYESPERKLYRSEFKDKEGLWTALVLNNSTMMYNTKLVPAKQAPKSYDDLLLPFWKDKISMDTELYEWFEGQLRIRGREKGLEFMKKLKAQNPFFAVAGQLRRNWSLPVNSP